MATSLEFQLQENKLLHCKNEAELAKKIYLRLIANKDELNITEVSQLIVNEEKKKAYHKQENNSTLNDVNVFINKYDHLFSVTLDKGMVVIRPVVKIEFCKTFDGKQGCLARSCPKLHVCRHYIKGKCTFGVKCKKPHHFDSPQTKKILREHCLDGLSPLKLKSFLCRNVQFALEDMIDASNTPRNLEICKYYNVAIGCSRDEQCPFLHVCRFYAEEGTCKFGTKCIRKHDFKNKHTQMLLERYKIREAEVLRYLRTKRDDNSIAVPPGLEDNFNNNCMLAQSKLLRDYVRLSNDVEVRPKFRTQSLNDCKQFELSSSVLPARKSSEPLSMEMPANLEICDKVFKGACNNILHCKKVHRTTPFSWEYSSIGWDWHAVGKQENLKIEKAFCDVEQNSVIVQLGQHLGNYTFQFSHWIAHRTNELARFQDLSAPILLMIRRLSTACAITNQHSTEDSSYLTTWIWYYGEGDTDKWHSYDAFDSQSKAALAMKMSSNTIELAYQLLGRSTLNFVGVNGRTFLIDFDRMVQQDLQAGTTFQVRRRPLFNANFDEDKQIKSFSDETSFFPSYWNSGLMSGFPGEDCELIDLPSSSNEYRVVYLSFIATMEHVTVSWIKAVQNPRLWMQYASKRESLREIDPGGAKEIYLFRSTSCSDAERICRYGFGYDKISRDIPRKSMEIAEEVKEETVQPCNQNLQNDDEDSFKLNEVKNRKKRKQLTSESEEDESIHENEDFTEESSQSQGYSIWVQCDNSRCLKWRRVNRNDTNNNDIIDGKWVCAMNKDESKNSCEASQESIPPEVNEDSCYTHHKPGNIFWAKVNGYPWWPCIIENDPDYNTFYWNYPMKVPGDIKTSIHVTFFGNDVTRAWVRTYLLRPFTGDENIKDMGAPERFKVFPYRRSRYVYLCYDVELSESSVLFIRPTSIVPQRQILRPQDKPISRIISTKVGKHMTFRKVNYKQDVMAAVSDAKKCLKLTIKISSHVDKAANAAAIAERLETYGFSSRYGNKNPMKESKKNLKGESDNTKKSKPENKNRKAMNDVTKSKKTKEQPKSDEKAERKKSNGKKSRRVKKKLNVGVGEEPSAELYLKQDEIREALSSINCEMLMEDDIQSDEEKTQLNVDEEDFDNSDFDTIPKLVKPYVPAINYDEVCKAADGLFNEEMERGCAENKEEDVTGVSGKETDTKNVLDDSKEIDGCNKRKSNSDKAEGKQARKKEVKPLDLVAEKDECETINKAFKKSFISEESGDAVNRVAVATSASSKAKRAGSKKAKAFAKKEILSEETKTGAVAKKPLKNRGSTKKRSDNDNDQDEQMKKTGANKEYDDNDEGGKVEEKNGVSDCMKIDCGNEAGDKSESILEEQQQLLKPLDKMTKAQTAKSKQKSTTIQCKQKKNAFSVPLKKTKDCSNTKSHADKIDARKDALKEKELELSSVDGNGDGSSTAELKESPSCCAKEESIQAEDSSKEDNLSMLNEDQSKEKKISRKKSIKRKSLEDDLNNQAKKKEKSKEDNDNDGCVRIEKMIIKSKKKKSTPLTKIARQFKLHRNIPSVKTNKVSLKSKESSAFASALESQSPSKKRVHFSKNSMMHEEAKGSPGKGSSSFCLERPAYVDGGEQEDHCHKNEDKTFMQLDHSPNLQEIEDKMYFPSMPSVNHEGEHCTYNYC
eukprot:gene15185-16747_t